MFTIDPSKESRRAPVHLDEEAREQEEQAEDYHVEGTGQHGILQGFHHLIKAFESQERQPCG